MQQTYRLPPTADAPVAGSAAPVGDIAGKVAWTSWHCPD